MNIRRAIIKNVKFPAKNGRGANEFCHPLWADHKVSLSRRYLRVISNIAVALDIAILVAAILAPPLSKMSACLGCPTHLVDTLERVVNSQPATLLDKLVAHIPKSRATAS